MIQEVKPDVAIELWRWRNTLRHLRQDAAKRIATRMQKRWPSDPFTYNRVYTHILNGITTPQDYIQQTKGI